MSYTIQFENDNSEAKKKISDGLRAYNQQFVGPYGYDPLTLTVRDPSGELLGGCTGGVWMNWLNIDLLWVREDMRGQGLGRQILRRIEEEGRKLGASRSILDTFEFQAKGFYEKEGYEQYGQIEDYASGYRRYFLAKRPL